MRKQPTVSINAASAEVGCRAGAASDDAEQIRRRLSELEAEVGFYQSRHQFLIKALETQRHARQILEASLTSRYSGAVSHARKIVQAVVPAGSTILVVSKGDPELLRFEGRRAWHFPRTESGGYAGHHPADSAAAIAALTKLIVQGAGYLLFPNTGFWWLEHYREFGEWLTNHHSVVWQDDRCMIYRLSGSSAAKKAVRRVQRKRSTKDASSAGAADPEHPAIICFPIIDWNFRYQRPQHLMSRFAAAGHKVFYLSHQLRLSGDRCHLRPLAPSLWEVSLRGPRFRARDGLLDHQHREELNASLAALTREHMSVGQPAIALVHSPYWWPVVKEAAEAFSWPVVYDCMDLHAGFATANPILLEQERELLASAQLVVASSALLEAQARQYNRNVMLVRNGCDYEHFSKVKAKVRKGRPVIGYYGAIAEWFDVDLVADLAQRRPDWDFLLIGSTTSSNIRRLSGLENVTFTGERPYTELPDWLARFHIAILPFRRTPLTDAANPVKAYEIFAAGKPLVSVPLPEILTFRRLVRLATTVQEFEQQILAELRRPAERSRSRRQRFARENSWDRRFDLFWRGTRSACNTIVHDYRWNVGGPFHLGNDTRKL